MNNKEENPAVIKTENEQTVTSSKLENEQKLDFLSSKDEQKLQVPKAVMDLLCPSKPDDAAKVESLTLDKLPEELILAIFYLLPNQEALSLARTCHSCYAVYKALPNSLHKHWLLQSLNLTPKTTTHRTYPESTKHDWKLATLNVDHLFERLGQCRSPGCEYQKYLRWLQGKKADCPIVRKALVGVSMLPNNFFDLFQDLGVNGTWKLWERSWKILGWLFPECEIGYVYYDVGQYFDFEEFLKLMDFILDPEESDKRLRQIMAEYEQIKCRGWFDDKGFKNLSFSKNDRFCSRQIGALIALVQLGNPFRDDDKNEIIYWADR